MIGVDVDGLLDGARRAVRDCTLMGEINPAAVSAAHAYLHAQNGIRIHNTFVFDPDLESLGKWYRQLLAESIGKSHDVGVTPIVSIGSTDLHSMAQLYLAGPHDKFTNFITRPHQTTTQRHRRHHHSPVLSTTSNIKHSAPSCRQLSAV